MASESWTPQHIRFTCSCCSICGDFFPLPVALTHLFQAVLALCSFIPNTFRKHLHPKRFHTAGKKKKKKICVSFSEFAKQYTHTHTHTHTQTNKQTQTCPKHLELSLDISLFETHTQITLQTCPKHFPCYSHLKCCPTPQPPPLGSSRILLQGLKGLSAHTHTPGALPSKYDEGKTLLGSWELHPTRPVQNKYSCGRVWILPETVFWIYLRQCFVFVHDLYLSKYIEL